MARERGHFSAAVHAPADRRSRDDHDTLYRSPGHLPCALYPQLDLQVGHRECFLVDESGLTIHGHSSPVLCTISTWNVPDQPLGEHRYWSEHQVDPIAVIAGLVQTGLYADFFYVYFTK